ncbi:unnamed protein product [Arabis nemorensis]|uniref:Uncharacterized protein n=1 Tax=Arabis nemorensis TaxID=586526 RepID=A0A565C9Q9_9BRAS|nr:unnamed protein product [Arabis nemorensis]
MSSLGKIKKEACVHGYESVWLNRWTRRGRGFELQARSNRDAECSTKINGQLWKESTGSMKLEGKMLSGFLDLFPNPDSAVQRVEMIPDMNKEPPLVAERENSKDGEEGESSSSATQSRNVEHFLNNNNNKSFKESKGILLDHETNSRSQVKRLKTNTSDYCGNETKGMKVVEGPSQEKVNYFFHRILSCGINKSGSTRNQERFQSRIKNIKRVGRGGEDEDFTLLHPWIQRWCKKKAKETHEQEVNPKGTALEKQFPSIAAMALMGKALSLTPTGTKKTNSLFVWNAQELR